MAEQWGPEPLTEALARLEARWEQRREQTRAALAAEVRAAGGVGPWWGHRYPLLTQLGHPAADEAQPDRLAEAEGAEARLRACTRCTPGLQARPACGQDPADGSPRRPEAVEADGTVRWDACSRWEAWQVWARARRLAGWGVPRRFWTATLTTYRPATVAQAAALEAARAYVAQWPHHAAHGTGLLLLGPPGTGKTHLAVAVARALAEAHGATPLVMEVPEWLAALRRQMDRPDAGEDPWDRFAEADLVVLDDLGAEYLRPAGGGPGWGAEQVYRLLNRGWADQRPLVATSNLSLEALADRLGERTLSRLLGSTAVLVVEGPDGRLQEAGRA